MKENLEFFKINLSAAESATLDATPQDMCTEDSWYECIGPGSLPLFPLKPIKKTPTKETNHGTTSLEPLPFDVVDAHVHLINTDNGIDYLWAVAPESLKPPQHCPCRPPCLCNWTLLDYKATSSSSWNVDKVFVIFIYFLRCAAANHGNQIGVRTSHTGFETCFGWEPQHLRAGILYAQDECPVMNQHPLRVG